MWQKIFDNTNPFWRSMSKLFDAVMLHFLWLLTSLPIVTAGASTAALHRVMYLSLREEAPSVGKAYFSAWQENFRQGTALFLLGAAAAGILIFDLWYFAFRQAYLTGTAKTAVCVLLAFVLMALLAVWMYAFILQAVFENSLKQLLQNSAILALRYMPRTLLMLAITLIYWAGAILSLYFAPALATVFLLFGISLPVFLNLLTVFPVLKKHLQEDGDSDDESEECIEE